MNVFVILPGGMRMRLSAVASYRYNEEKGETRLWLLGDPSPIAARGNIVARLDALLGSRPLEELS